MSKAILVIDMPKSCKDCNIMFTDNYSDYCPCNRQDVFNYVCSDTRPDWCPLKKVPEKPDYPPINESSFVAGYNACIDEILKGSEKR